MAPHPTGEPTNADANHLKKPFSWGWLVLGGCLGLLLVLSPIILMVVGMGITDVQMKRVLHRTPEASELVCHEVAPAVVARIEAGLRVRDGHLDGARAVRSAENPQEWYIAAEVQGIGYETDGDVAVWRLRTRGDPSTGEGSPDAPIATVEVRPGGYPRNAQKDEPFAEVPGILGYPSNFPQLYTIDSRVDLVNATEACLAPQASTPPASSATRQLECRPATPSVVASIEARLTVPGTTVRGMQVVQSDTDPALWVLAADLEGEDRYEGGNDIGVWTVRWAGATPPSTPKAPASVAAVNGLAALAGPFSRSAADSQIVTAAVRCVYEALGHDSGGD